MVANSAIETDFEADRCKVCQVDCNTPEQKELHLRFPLHNRRKNISAYLAKIAANPVQSTRSSEISRRYALLKENVLGADCIVEFVFPWCESGWWACSICYESGNNYDLLDQHLSSRRHLGIYLNELISDPNINALTCDAGELLRLKDDIFERGEMMLPPDVISLSISKPEAMSSLVISDRSPPYSTHESGQKNMVFLSCQVCHESFLSIVKGPEQLRAWDVHSVSPAHRNALYISNVIGLCNPKEVVDETANTNEHNGPFGWRNYELLLDGKQPPPGVQMQGPVCGINHLVTFNDQAYCGLCFCAVHGLEEHFSSESHIIRFVNKTKPKAGFIMTQCHERLRRSKLLSNLDRHGLSIDRSRCCECPMPKELRDRIVKGPLPLPEPIPMVEPFDNKNQCIFCPICIAALQLKENEDPIAVWHKHLVTAEHLRMCAKRNEYYLDDKFFVPTRSSIEWELNQINETLGHWTEEDGKWIQNQFNIGLEFIIDNRNAEQFICTQCAEVFHYSQKAQALHHLRSLDHLTKYLHISNRDLISKFERKEGQPTNMREMRRMLDANMDLLQIAPHRLSQLTDARVYDPQLAVRMEYWGKINKRTVELSGFEFEQRDLLETVYELVDKVADDDAETQEISLREALLATSIKVLEIGESTLICRCLKCQNVIVTEPSKLVEDMSEHLSKEEHQRRQIAILSCQMAPNGFTDQPSGYTVKEFEQKDPIKKVTWHYNQTLKMHEFVLAIVGLQDIVERKSNEHDIEPPDPTECDFYCRLCLVSFPRKAQALESHIRSSTHILQYVHKYHPTALKKIEQSAENDNGREFRKVLAQLLKDVKPPSQYCIMVYDPFGERQRRAILAMQRAQEDERRRAEEEERKVAEETRKKKDEERRKQREAEYKARARIQAERDKLEAAQREKRMKIEAQRERLEKEARERRAMMEAREQKERDQLMALAFAKQQELEAARNRLEQERQMIEETKKGKERAILQARLSEERRRLDEQIRDKQRQKQLIEDRKKLEQELEDVRRRKAETEARRIELENRQQSAAIASRQSASVPRPSLIIPPAPTLNLPLTQPNLMPGLPMLNPVQFTVPPPTFNAGVPPPSVAMSMGQPISFNMANPNIRPPPQLMPQQAIPWQTVRPTLANVAVDPYLLDPAIITSREQLLDFMERQGTIPIPKEEVSLIKRFNTYVASVQGLLGLASIYEVVCLDDPKLESYYCSLCRHWALAGEMIKHMESNVHRLAYLFKFRVAFHNAVMSETNVMVRDCMIEQFAVELWKREQPGAVLSQRLRAVLNKQVVQRLWPNYYLSQDQSWKYDPRAGSPIPVDPSDTSLMNLELPGRNTMMPMNVSMVWEGGPMENLMHNEMDRRSDDRARRRSSRSPSGTEKTKEEVIDGDHGPGIAQGGQRREIEEGAQVEVAKRSRSRDRRRPKSRSPNRSHLMQPLIPINSTAPIGHPPSWEESAAAFLQKIGDTKAASKVLESQAAATRLPLPNPPSTSQARSENNENAQLRKMLGLLVTMQKEAETRGSLDDQMINQIYGEMGLKRNADSEADALLVKVCSLIGGTSAQDPTKAKPKIDLSVFGIEEANPATPPKNFGVDSIPTFGQNSENLYGIRKDPAAQLPKKQQDGSSSSALPPHLQTLLSGLKGTLNQLKFPSVNTSTAPQPSAKGNYGDDLLRPNLVHRPDDVLSTESNVKHIYPGAHDQQPPPKPQGRNDNRPFGNTGATYSPMDYPPPVQNRPPLPKSQLPVPVHPGQAGRSSEDGYDAVFPVKSREPNMPGGAIRNQSGPSGQSQGYNSQEPRMNPDGKPSATRNMRKKMRKELREKGYNPDAFNYYQSGPEPIPGKNLQLPADFRPSQEDLEGDFSHAEQPRQPQRGIQGQGRPPQMIELDEDDWEGAVGSLNNLMTEKPQQRHQQGTSSNQQQKLQPLMEIDYGDPHARYGGPKGGPTPGRSQSPGFARGGLQYGGPSRPQGNDQQWPHPQGNNYPGYPRDPYAPPQPQPVSRLSQLRGAPPPPPSNRSGNYPNYPPRGY
ncbi:unnamed protein product, partial [Mesorhabditis belari]|uniref:C2H2-type domain-containing protein n=1 Tax=Mesorhabditis belari TaxID=2138241 RepID=A0AAF3F3X7_9BILA